MPSYQDQREVLKAVATTLKGNSIPFALAGGYAVWARGGPESDHDVDFVVRPADADVARATLISNGLQEADNTEDWLVKVARDGIVVDLIHRLPFGDVDDDLLARCDSLPVDSVRMPVLGATDLLLSRVLAFSVHACDFGPVLGFARALREQVDWERVRRDCTGNPFAEAFLHLVVALEVVPQEVIRHDGEPAA